MCGSLEKLGMERETQRDRQRPTWIQGFFEILMSRQTKTSPKVRSLTDWLSNIQTDGCSIILLSPNPNPDTNEIFQSLFSLHLLFTGTHDGSTYFLPSSFSEGHQFENWLSGEDKPKKFCGGTNMEGQKRKLWMLCHYDYVCMLCQVNQVGGTWVGERVSQRPY